MSTKHNIFDELPSLAPVTPTTKNELERYLQTPVKNVKNALEWWVKNQAVYPHLSWMALDYLSIPGMSSNDFHMHVCHYRT